MYFVTDEVEIRMTPLLGLLLYYLLNELLEYVNPFSPYLCVYVHKVNSFFLCYITYFLCNYCYVFNESEGVQDLSINGTEIILLSLPVTPWSAVTAGVTLGTETFLLFFIMTIIKHFNI